MEQEKGIVKKIDAGCWTFQTNASYNPNTGNYTSQYDPVPNPASKENIVVYHLELHILEYKLNIHIVVQC